MNTSMNLFRIALHSIFLASLNIASIIVAYGFYYFLKPANQIVFQAPVAAVLSILAFLVWYMIVQRIPLKSLFFGSWPELIWTFLLALLWIPLIFVPLHFTTQGYLTTFDNITAIWLFQIPTNLLAIFLANRVVGNLRSTPKVKDAEGSGDGVSRGHDGNGQSGTPPGEFQINKALLGLLAFIGSEVMFFGGLISSFIILRAGTQTWPPVAQPRLPIEVTGINTLFLLVSGYTMLRAVKSIRQGSSSSLTRWLSATTVFGSIFLAVQGYEWMRLVSYGLTFTSSVYGGTFYTLIGFHALHVVGAMIFLLFVLKNAIGGKYSLQKHTPVMLCGVYWYFVVGIWPVLYILVYLN